MTPLGRLQRTLRTALRLRRSAILVTRPLTKGQHSGFGEIVALLRKADVTFGNMETNIFNIRSFQGSPQAEYGGAYHVGLPALGADLKAMGFNVVGYANNHTFDWGVEGMRETIRALDQNDIVHAGAGETLADAGAARFLETARCRGRPMRPARRRADRGSTLFVWHEAS